MVRALIGLTVYALDCTISPKSNRICFASSIMVLFEQFGTGPSLIDLTACEESVSNLNVSHSLLQNNSEISVDRPNFSAFKLYELHTSLP